MSRKCCWSAELSSLMKRSADGDESSDRPMQSNFVASDLPRQDVWHLDEVVISIAGRKHWLWRAVDQDGYVRDEIVQSRRDTKAAKRLLIRLLKKAGMPRKRIITDKLRSYGAATRDVMPDIEHRSHKVSTIERKIPICLCGNGRGPCKVSDQPEACSGSSRSSRHFEISSSPHATNDPHWPLTFIASALWLIGRPSPAQLPDLQRQSAPAV